MLYTYYDGQMKQSSKVCAKTTLNTKTAIGPFGSSRSPAGGQSRYGSVSILPEMEWRIYLSGESPVSLETYKRGYIDRVSDKMRTYGVRSNALRCMHV